MDIINSVKESEYDAQLFGFTVEDFMIAFRQLIKGEISRLTSAMASTFIKKYPEGDPEIKIIENTRRALANKYMCGADIHLDILKTQLKELMHIPRHVLLPEDEVQKTQYSAEEEQEVDDQLKDLFRRLKRVKAFKIELQQELKMLQDVLPDLSKRVEELEECVAQQNKEEEALKDIVPFIDKSAIDTKALLQFENKSLND